MAHRSKKKHLKHLHEHEPATPPAKSPVAKAKAAAAGIAARTGNRRRAPELEQRAKRKKRIASLAKRAKTATTKLAARPRKIASRAKARVKALLGAEER